MPKKCPTLKKPCIEHECAWYVALRGKNPTTGVDVDEWGCAMAWLPVVMCEVAMRANQTSAEVSKLRSVVANAQPLALAGDADDGDPPRVVNGG